MNRRGDIAAAALLALAIAIVLWVRLVPLSLPAVPERAASTIRAQIGARLTSTGSGAATPADRQYAADRWVAAHPDEFAAEVSAETARLMETLQYTDDGGRRRTFLGDYDSYAWLRAARTYLRSGTVCDDAAGDECRDHFTLAPVGTAMRYGRSLHVAAIVAVHRVTTWLDPHYPLAASAYLVPVIVGALGVVPAFALGRRLAGPVGGFVSGVVGGLHPVFLQRSLGSDNDVWNVVLPCALVWAVIAALQARQRAAQIAYAAFAGAMAGLHAATWRGWTLTAAVVLAGLGATLVLYGLRWVLDRRTLQVWRAPRVRTVAVVLLAYCAATAVFTYAGGAEQWTARRATAEPAASGAGPFQRASLQWPSALAQVSELYVPTLGIIAAQSYGNVIFFAGWLGMLLLLLPRHDWMVPHFAVLIGATLLYRYLLTAAGLGRATLIALLMLPLAAAAAVALRAGDDADLDDAGAGVIVAAWLLAALLMSYQAARFMLLLAAPLGVTCGVAAGRLHLWLDRQARAQFGPRAALPRLLAGAAVLAIAMLPISSGYATARAYVPSIDRAWADTLETLRTTTPPDAIVNTWWDYGYWTKYLAERAVSADGGTLLTHVPHWLARAQLAVEPEALGLLRMLNCGSDALPYPEGADGAYGKLIRLGLDGLGAYNALVQVARLDRAAADRHLAALGLDPAARADVLASTHCQPPPSYLVLSSRQATLEGWWALGRWDPNRDGGSAPTRRELVTSDWVSCMPTTDGEKRCDVRRVDAGGTRIDAVVYRDDDARSVRVIATSAGGVESTAPPDLLMIADGGAIESVGESAAKDGTAVLLDRDHQRVLIGSPAALASLYTHLVFLDGLGTSHFRKLGEHSGMSGQRVTTWAIEW